MEHYCRRVETVIRGLVGEPRAILGGGFAEAELAAFLARRRDEHLLTLADAHVRMQVASAIDVFIAELELIAAILQPSAENPMASVGCEDSQCLDSVAAKRAALQSAVEMATILLRLDPEMLLAATQPQGGGGGGGTY
eukprot:NODE_2545_length_1173_cov_21.096975_g2326_i0.p3 GENE.NODE_2545_length_1173_cov_21.096975_g2326_i0~~NODE_2545_length_1173_cov_21.096975_g2326_i0.p3  ORF type:complete len:138 (-),score=32.36 NODE_2545_length_1173_cov_21.096975_g2326_i0:38-451(-)